MDLMKLYIDDLKSELYKNVRNQIELQNNLVDLRRGNLVIKRRYNEDYFYLSYRENNKVRTDYLGKLNDKEIKKLQKELNERKKIKKGLKDLKIQEEELRKLILAINRKAFIKKVYDVMDLIVMLRPVLLWSRAKEAYLFGSYARGEMDESSDINIELIDSKKDKAEIEKKLEKATGKAVNVIYNGDKINNRVREVIDREKFLIYGDIN